jgi:glutamyl-tRNA synthetase
MADKCQWYFVSADQLDYDPAAVKKHLKPAIKEPLSELISEFEALDVFAEEELEVLFHKICEKHEIKLGKLAQPVRVSLTGTSVSPPIFTVVEIVGRDESIARLKRGLGLIS